MPRAKSRPAAAVDAEPIFDDDELPAHPMDAAPFDPDVHRREARQAASRALWSRMVLQDRQVRLLHAGLTQVVDPAGTVLGIQQADRAFRRSVLPAAEKDAARLRGIAAKVLPANGVDELDLLAGRIAALTADAARFRADLILYEDMRDHPGYYGKVTPDGRRLDPAVIARAIDELTAAIADTDAELGWYLAVADAGG